MKTKQNIQRKVIGALALLMLLFCTNIIQAQVSKTVNVVTAGTLHNLLTPIEKTTITNLTLTGNMDARDLFFMRDSMTVLSVLNFSRASILRYLINNPENQIPQNAFLDKTTLTKVVFPCNLKSIENWAFMGCHKLSALTFPSTLQTLGDYSFAFCDSLRVVENFSSEAHLTDSHAFYVTPINLCELKVPTLSLSEYQSTSCWNLFNPITASGFCVTAIPNQSLQGNIAELENRFYSMNDTVTITAVPFTGVDFENWTSNGVVLSTNPTISFIITQDTFLVANFKREMIINVSNQGTLEEQIDNPSSVSKINISGDIDARDIKFIRDSMLSIKSIDLSNSTIQLYEGTLGTCDYLSTYPANQLPVNSFYKHVEDLAPLVFDSITLPDNLISIGDSAFFSNVLQKINTHQGLLSIGGCSFYGCLNLKSFDFPDGLISISDGAFYYCQSLDSINLPNTITNIGANAFTNCININKVLLPDHLTTINSATFSGCSSLINLTLPSDLTTIESGAFVACCSLPSICFPNNLGYIGWAAFGDCTSLDTVYLQEGLQTIENYAFQNCSSLSVLKLPSSLSDLSDWSFWNCSSLIHITNYASTPLQINQNVFDGVNQSLCTLYVPNSPEIIYQTANVWKYFSPIIGIPTFVENSLMDICCSVFPNPASNQITIEANTDINSIRVFDVLGNQILNSFLNNPSVLLNTESMEPGIYFISIETNLGIKTQKINIIR